MRRKIKLPPCFDFLHAELISAENGRAVVRFVPTEEMEHESDWELLVKATATNLIRE
jgi:hypothetical protein